MLTLRAVPKQSRCATAAAPGSEVLHVDDLAVTDAEPLAPAVSRAGGIRPREEHGYAIAAGVDVVESEVGVARMLSPSHRRLENLTGLSWTVSGRTWLPETPVRTAPPAPLHVRMHERDQRLDITRAERFVRRPNLLHESMVVDGWSYGSEVITAARITCPACGFEKSESMPTNSCQVVYRCESCGTVLRPLQGDCCVFCSYSDQVCPPKQA